MPKIKITVDDTYEMQSLQSDPWIKVNTCEESIRHIGLTTTQRQLKRNLSLITKTERVKEVVRDLSAGVMEWFGVGDHPLSSNIDVWQNRVVSAHSNNHLLGGYKEEFTQRFDSESCIYSTSKYPSPAPPSDSGHRTPHPVDPLALKSRRIPSRQTSKISDKSKHSPSLQRRESILHMAYEGVKNLTGTKSANQMFITKSRSYSPHQLSNVESLNENEEDTFFDDLTSTSPHIFMHEQQTFEHNHFNNYQERNVAFIENKDHPLKPGWGGNRHLIVPSTEWGMQRIENNIVKQKAGNGWTIGSGFAGFLTDAEFRCSRIDSDLRRRILEPEEHRSYFTYWVTFVQITCYLISICIYDLAPFGVSMFTSTSEILKPNLAIEVVEYTEVSNMWIGIRQSDLIHLGAKYSACMRKDVAIFAALEKDRELENLTACCVRVDGSGCYQASEMECLYPRGFQYSKTSLNNWKTWNKGNGPYGRMSGSVCHQDPRFCKNPQTPHGYQLNWTDDITNWPPCLETYDIRHLPSNIEHMTCDITGRPCCIGIQGECIITTREDCLFRRGYYHDNINLCSQVHCLEEICGMMAFFNSENPDQIFRLFISLFLHAGAIQLTISVLFQLTIMRDLEKLNGWLRISLIYFGSGMAGNLASVIILPHNVDVGPSGSQFGLLACLFAEVIQTWKILKSPSIAILRLILILFTLFVIGLLPMVDNFAHIAGFLFGFLLSFIFLPYITPNSSDRQLKKFLIILCLIISTCLLVGLFLIFYMLPNLDCEICRFFNCFPFTSDFCQTIPVTVERSRKEV